MKKFLTFETFISPWLVKWYWYLMTVACIFVGIDRVILGAKQYGYFMGVFDKPDYSTMLSGIGIMIGVPLLLRVICEVILSIVEKRLK